MMRVTLTIPDELEEALETYAKEQQVRPRLSAVVKDALREYLSQCGASQPRRHLHITPTRQGSGRKDVSLKHDR